MVHIVGGCNGEGYDHALLKALGDEFGVEQMPRKGSLSKVRQKVSYQFFADRYLLESAEFSLSFLAQKGMASAC